LHSFGKKALIKDKSKIQLQANVISQVIEVYTGRFISGENILNIGIRFDF
jgi:hypothetical protein